MKIITKIRIILLFLFIPMVYLTFTDNKTLFNKTQFDSDKTLVAYFSATGNTKQVSHTLADALDYPMMYKIRPVKPYTSKDLDWRDNNSRSSIEMANHNIRPEIVSDGFNTEGFDTIFLGFPIWGGTAPNIIRTFLENNDFSNKKIIIYATSGSSGLGNTANDLKSSVPDSAQIIEGKVLNKNASVDELRKWVKSLK